MNYPGNLQGSLLDKYESRRKERENQENNSNKKRNSIIVNEYKDREERMRERMLNRNYNNLLLSVS